MSVKSTVLYIHKEKSLFQVSDFSFWISSKQIKGHTVFKISDFMVMCEPYFFRDIQSVSNWFSYNKLLKACLKIFIL